MEADALGLAHLARATVRAGGFETPYLRAGSGPTLLYLRASRRADGPGHLIRALAGRFRVVLPLAPGSAGEDGAADWLRGVIDGLGIETAVILSEPALAGAAFALAAEQPTRIRGVALVVPEVPTEAEALCGALDRMFSPLPPAGEC